LRIVHIIEVCLAKIVEERRQYEFTQKYAHEP